MTVPPLPSGLYDVVLTESIERLLTNDTTARHQIRPVAEDAAEVLADILVRQLAALLEDLPGEGAEAAQRQLTLVNELLVWLRQRLQSVKGERAAATHIEPAPMAGMKAVKKVRVAKKNGCGTCAMR